MLLLLFAVLAAGVWWFELREPPKPAASTTSIPISDVKPEDVMRIEVVDAGKTVVVERTENGWRLTAPDVSEADTLRVGDLLNRLGRANATRKLDNVGELGQYGLAQPASRVTLTRRDATVTTLLVGGKSPDGASTYVKLQESADVLVAPSFVVSDLARIVSDPPKLRPTPTALSAPTTPVGGVSPLPPSTSPPAKP